MRRKDVLDRAAAAVGERDTHYGQPEDNFLRIARRWSVHLVNRFGVDVTLAPADVAIMMADLKLARLEKTPQHEDSWVDLAGYAACGGEVAALDPGDVELPSDWVDFPASDMEDEPIEWVIVRARAAGRRRT